MRKLTRLWAVCLIMLCAACSGGGGDDKPSAAPASSSTPPATATPEPAATPVANQVSVVVGPGPFGSRFVNMPQVSVTVCVPGTATCQTIPNVQLDTGSFGLRLMASAVTIALPRQTAAVGGTLANCATFASGVTWGAVANADVKLAGEVASNIPVQIVGDAAVGATPPCQGVLANMSSASALGANGMLGVGMEVVDCGPDCVASSTPGVYYGCASPSSCTPSVAPLRQQVTNPVAMFPVDNNGVVVQLPAVSEAGTSSVTGTLTFGIGTQANNGLGAAKVYTVTSTSSPRPLTLTTTYKGQVFSNSFIDSGSNAFFFPDGTIPQCAGAWYCPPATQNLSALMQGNNGANASINFAIANSTTMFAAGDFAMSSLGGFQSGMFDWGLPFFFGRTVYTAIDGRATPGGNGPYYAF
jgi:hypothetical protein